MIPEFSVIDGNAPVFRGPGVRNPPMVESYFIKLVSPDGTHALWLRWTFFVDAHAPPRAELWAVSFVRGLLPVAAKRSEPANASSVTRFPWRVTHGDSTYDGAHTVGAVSAGASRFRWDLTLTPTLGPLALYPSAWMYRSRAIPSKVLTPIPDARAHGCYVVDGDTIVVDGWRAMQGHNWGRRHPGAYAWSHAAGFLQDASVVFEGFSARPSIGRTVLPWMSMAALHLDGRWLRFDSLRAAIQAKATVAAVRWDFECSNGTHTLTGRAFAETPETAGLYYPSPGGAVTACLNSKLAHLDLTLTSPGDARRQWTTESAALEVATTDTRHGVRMLA